jgi:hypothetical protein
MGCATGSRRRKKEDQLAYTGELVGAYGFAQVVGHAGFQATFFIAAHGVCRERDDRQMIELSLLSNASRGFDAVELGHLHVHENPIEVCILLK